MKCHDIRQILITYLDSEATPLEQKQLREHITGCAECQAEMVVLRKLQSHLHRALKTEAAQVAPSPGAWRQLQSRLTAESLDPPARLRGNGLLHRLNLLGSNSGSANRKNTPAGNTSQDWSWTTTPTIKQWWHQGLVWAARWSTKPGMGRPSKKRLTIHNSQVSGSGDDGPEGSVE